MFTHGMRTLSHVAATLVLAVALAGAAHAAPPKDPLIAKGSELVNQKKYAEAVTELSAVLAANPSHVEATRLRGIAQRNLRQFDAAIRDFTRVIELDPKNYNGYAGRAATKRGASNLPGAIEDMEAAVRLAPPKAASSFLITLSYYFRDSGNKQAELDACIRSKEAEVSIFSLRCTGWAQLRLGQYEKARQEFDQFIALDDKEFSAYTGRGAAHLELGQLDKARSDFDKVAELRPDVYANAEMQEKVAKLSALEQKEKPSSGEAGSSAKAGKSAGAASGTVAGKTSPPAPAKGKEPGKEPAKEEGKESAESAPSTAATRAPSEQKRHVYRLVKTEIPPEDKVWEDQKRSGWRMGYEGQGTKMGFHISWDLNGRTYTRRIRWSVPEEIVPGQAAKFKIEGSISGELDAYAFIDFNPGWWGVQELPNRMLTGTRVLTYRSWDSTPSVPSGEYDLVLPAELGLAPEECRAGRCDREVVTRLPSKELEALFYNSQGANISKKVPKDVPVEDVRHRLKNWVSPNTGELTGLVVTVFLDHSRYPLAIYRYRALVDVMDDGIEFQTEPLGRKELRADGRDGLFLKARAKGWPDEPAPGPEATRDITFSGTGEGAGWIDLSKSEMRAGWKVVQVQASNPDSVRGPSKPPAILMVRAETQDRDRLLAGNFAITVPPDPVVDAKPDVVEFMLKSGKTAEVKVWIENGGKAPWKFRSEFAKKDRALATAAFQPTEGETVTLNLKEAGLDPKSGGSSTEVSVLRLIAEQKDRDPVERHIKIVIGQEGVFATTFGRDPEGNFYHVAADGSAKTTDVDFRVFLEDPGTKKLVNNKEAAGKLKIECLEPEGSVAAQALKTGQLKFFFAGTRSGNDPTGIYRFSLAKELPGDGRIIRCDFKATYPGRGEENFSAIFSLGLVTTSNGPGGADWQLELDRCQEVINKFVPPAYRAKMQAILDKHKRTLGAQGLHLLREKIWKSAVELTLGEGGQGYADEAAWADRITVTLEWAEWAGDMAFGAVIGTWTGPYGATGASMLKAAVISALNAYQEGRSADEWLWENLSTIPGILEGKVIDVDTFEKMGMQSKAKAWAVFIGYHFCKNLYNGATVIEALKSTAKEVGNGVLSDWLSEKVKKGVVKAPEAAPSKPQGAELAAKAASTESDAAKRIQKNMVTQDGKPYAKVDDVLATMRDPSQVRALKSAPPEVQKGFSNTREAVYRQHDTELVNYVKDNVPGMKDRRVKVMEFRTPGQDAASINTDRDYRVCYYAGTDPRTGKEQWVEVDRRHWENHSYQTFARITGGPADSSEAARHWAESHQQLGTDKAHAEASPDFTDQAKVWNPQSRKFENAQIVPNIVQVKAGEPGARLKDPQALGQMYQMKVGDAKFKHEAFVQAQKAVKELDAIRKAYGEQELKVGSLPPSVQAGMNTVLEVNKKLAADPNRRDPKAVADAEKTLRDNGFQNLGDFMNKLSSQFEALKNAKK